MLFCRLAEAMAAFTVRVSPRDEEKQPVYHSILCLRNVVAAPFPGASFKRGNTAPTLSFRHAQPGALLPELLGFCRGYPVD